MKNKKIMGYNIFVPVDKSLKVTITPNFYTHECKWCDCVFNAFRPNAGYCSPSHKAAAGRKRQQQKYIDEIAFLKSKIKTYEQSMLTDHANG